MSGKTHREGSVLDEPRLSTGRALGNARSHSCYMTTCNELCESEFFLMIKLELTNRISHTFEYLLHHLDRNLI